MPYQYLLAQSEFGRDVRREKNDWLSSSLSAPQ